MKNNKTKKLVCLRNHILEQNNVSQERFKTLYLILLNTLLDSIDIKQRQLDARGRGWGWVAPVGLSTEMMFL